MIPIQINVFGEASIQYAEISNVSHVEISGTDAAIFTTITSTSGFNTNVFTLEIDGTQSSSMDVKCTAGDICFIDCQSQYACQLINLWCYGMGNCVVNCGDGIIDGMT